MEASFKSFALGFLISFVLLFLILTAQFKSFVDPLLIMLGDTDGLCRSADHPAAHGQHVECDVADGSVDAGGDRGLEQYLIVDSRTTWRSRDCRRPML